MYIYIYIYMYIYIYTYMYIYTVMDCFVDSSEGIGRKRRMSSTTDRYRARILDGHRDRQIRRLRLPRHSHSG